MRWRLVAAFLLLLGSSRLGSSADDGGDPGNPSPSTAPPPLIIPNAVNGATATIIYTAPAGDIPAKTWISFDEGPLVEVDDDLSLEALAAAYNKTAGKKDRRGALLEPFSFESPYADPVCVFNGTIVPATVTGPNQISCDSPAIESVHGAAVPFQVSSNGGHDVSATEVFVYLAKQEREALLLEPNHGPTAGGTRVYVRGVTHGPVVDAAQRALCKFGTHIAEAVEVGSDGDYVICESPPRSANDYASSVEVDISVIGQSNVFSGVTVVFRYDETFSISSIHPSSGLVIGGTQVAVRGGPFQNPGEIVCRFGEKTVEAIYHDDREISCLSPNLGWINEVQRVSVFTMAANPEIQTISAKVDDYVNEIHTCQTSGDSDLSDDELGRGFRLVAPGGSIEYPLTRHTRWIHFNETADGMEEALSGLFPEGFYVNRTGPLPHQTYKWQIVLPKSETFDGETLHVVNTGGGAVRLRGANASVACALEQKGTKRLGGEFMLTFSDDSSVQSTIPIAHNATNGEVKAALEELDGIDRVIVNSNSLDDNLTGSGAFEWHVMFDSLKNAGDAPLLIADYSSLVGSDATIDISETRKGTSHAVFRIDVPFNASSFNIALDGIEGQTLSVAAFPADVMEAVEALGWKSLVVERYEDAYFFLDIKGYPLEGRLSAKFDTGELRVAVEHAPATASQLGGHFTLEYPTDRDSCRACRHVTEPINAAFATAMEVETALHRLELVDEVKVVVTESERFGEYKVDVQSGIVGFNRNFHVHFMQSEFSSSTLVEPPFRSTAYSGDIPMLRLNQNHLQGTPTRDAAYSQDYSASVIEVTKGTDLNHGGMVEVAVSLNGGHDYSDNNPLFEYEPVPIVQSIAPTHGSIAGGTTLRVSGSNFSRKAARFCLFWGIGAPLGDGSRSGLIELVSISKYTPPQGSSLLVPLEEAAIAEITCQSPPSLKAQWVHVAVVPSQDLSTLGGTLQARGELFRYHEEIEVSGVLPASAPVSGNATVDVLGGPFFSNEGLFCRFGRVVVPGAFHSPTQISCTAPAHASGAYSLEVTQNGHDFTTSGHAFRFYHACSVHQISPISGPAKRAGTNVRVSGENFVNTTQLQCRFGSRVVPATFIDSSEISCSSPPIKISDLADVQMEGYYPQEMRGRLVSIEVSNNGQDFTSSGTEFLYLQDIEASLISRKGGSSRGGTPVYISGSHFVNNTQLTCRFGSKPMLAHFLTRGAVLCFSPPLLGEDYLNSAKEKPVPLLVSNNAEDYAFVGDFTYTSSLPDGTYQAGTEGNDTLLSCPRGAWCNGLTGTNFTLCNPGTYQPLPGQDSCIECPRGYHCSEFGMTVPRICPEHFVCDERGMSRAKPCPTNYICDRGTATLSTACLKSFDFGTETCFDNSTDDFGLQASEYPAQIWAERHLMPLDEDASVAPIRGRFCLDNSCIDYLDSDNFQVIDKSFDYTSTGFDLRRPRCREGTNCSPDISPTARTCSPGHFCRHGKKTPCGPGTMCPRNDMTDPLPCEPGTFNFMIGQEKCSECPIGYYCPSYGLLDPVICPPGYVCSRKGLTAMNIRCPAGFYCHNGTKTSDPFRNDTTLRPYACTPGTFCFAGTGSNEVQEGVTGYAQPCASGFFCEAASTSAKGSGACPPSFQCPKGTANPRPTPKGFHAEHPGTIESTACLPGFYAPTIQTDKCYECPPGTSCSFEGLFEAEECGPGTYRATIDESGHSCVPCPQGTWSKNWGLREKGECNRCPTGVVCPLEGMTNPCSYEDLPTPYEPIVRDFKGMPAFEYEFPADARPPPFSMDECLALNSNAKKSANPEYFYGELVPPYIDILGRGPHFREADPSSLKYQRVAKCYKNSQPHGSLVYQRMADYYGPQYDIQTGHPHQGYGIALLNNQIFATAPPEGYEFSFNYFRGEGNGYIDLPKARVYDPAFNCTKGMMLMNSSLVMEDERRVVYTDPTHDYEGGYDIQKCPAFDAELGCYVDDTFEVHAKGECCNVRAFEPRAVYLAHDQFYHGTCEADIICAEGGLAPPQAKPCDAGFVCDEGTSLATSLDYPCPAGYECDFATTPDTDLRAPGSQLKTLCKEGHWCGSDDLGRPSKGVCQKDYWCPTGTSDPLVGALANDGLLRMIGNTPADRPINIQYQGGDAFALLNEHDQDCSAAALPSLQNRYQAKMSDRSNPNYLEYLADESEWPIVTSEALPFAEKCARDNKAALVRDAHRRKECNCASQFLTLASVYRFWMCTSNEPLDDLGLGESTVPLVGRGKRDFWYPYRIHLDYGSAVATDPAMEIFGLSYGEGNVCNFSEADDVLTLRQGKLPDEKELPDASSLLPHASGYLELSTDGLPFRFTSAETRVFEGYSELKREVRAEYDSEREQAANGNRTGIDPFIFDLHTSIQLIEQFGQRLEDFVYLEATNETSVTSIQLGLGVGNDTYSQEFDFVSLDWCSCADLLKCPNGTSSNEGATSMSDCRSTKKEVLHRMSLLPPTGNATVEVPSTEEGTVDESATLRLEPFDVAILTVDQSALHHNLTYGEHYVVSLYDGCKPCPLRYQCNRAGDDEGSCSYPPTDRQVEILNQCLKDHRKLVCLRADGSQEDVTTCEKGNATDDFILVSEPDLEKCLSLPYLCSDSSWNFLSFRRLCQDTLDDGSFSPIYDCADVQRWQAYSQWRNEICCSGAPELRGVASCQNASVCADDPLIETIIRDKLQGVFELEHGYLPPRDEPKGQLLLNASLQEAIDHDSPLDLFNEWQAPFRGRAGAGKVALHNKYEPESSQSWMSTPGCCECRRHPMPAFFETNAHVSGYPDDKHQQIQLTISALAEVELTVVVELIHGAYYAEFSDYFAPRDKSLLRVHSPERFSDDHEQATWLAVIEEANFDREKLDLPLNLPTRITETGVKEIESRFLVDRPSNISIGDQRLAANNDSETDADEGRALSPTRPTSDPIHTMREEDSWWPDDFLALPYFPFFSNCDGYDSHISLSRLLEEHPDCKEMSYDQTVPTKEYAFRGQPPASDACLGVVLRCTYEEEVRQARKNLRWFEAPPGATLFRVTKDAVPPGEFVPSSDEEEWGRTLALDDLRDQDLVPVLVDKEMGGHRHAIPRKVQLELKYYQISQGTKRLVEAELHLDELCTTQQPEHFGGSAHILDMMAERNIAPCPVDVNGNIKSQDYALEVTYHPLPWFELLNRFEFGGSVYFVFFTLMGLAICSVGGFIYVANRFLTKLRHPPTFLFHSMMRLVSQPQLEGAALAVIPYMAVVLMVHSLFSDSAFAFTGMHRDWITSGVVRDEEQLENAMGRMGSAFVVLGFYTVYRATKKLIPSAQAHKVGAEEKDGDAGKLASKRGHFLWVGLAIQAALLSLWEFSYSHAFRDNIFRFKVLFQLCQVLADLVTAHIMGDRLLAAPLLVSIQMAELLVTIGARNFTEFALTFLVEISLSVVQRLFLYPLIRTVLTLLPRWKLLVSHTFGRKGLTREEKQQREAQWQKVNEDIELKTEGIEPLLDSLAIYSVEKCGAIMLPFMCLQLMLLYSETEIALNYGINQRDLLFYALFAFYMIPWSSLVDAFILGSQELLYGWRVHDYLSYQKWRFTNRERRWNLRGHVDESVTPSLQNVDLLCFSSQHYFILSIIALGFGNGMLGITICLRREYNFLGDPVFPLIVAIVIACCELISRICLFVSSTSIDAISWGGIWNVSRPQGTMDDVIAAKLAIGEGRQEDLEQERQELEAMNSETFRHKFLEKNRPWVLQHLVELITPEALQEAGPDGTPLIEYVREVYSSLMNAGTGINRREDDRASISSDSSDDEEERRRQWDRTPLEGSRLLIAQIWIQKARKRRVFTQAVAALVEKRKEDHCTTCSRTLGACSKLTAGLEWDGKFDPGAIDGLIKQFEDAYTPEESDPVLWKAFFRENARFSTVCNICVDAQEQAALHKTVRRVGDGVEVPTRPGDISSDDESDDDGARFAPVIVSRSSDEGTMMSKWLQAAREKLGGDFPRTSAVGETEKYLERLKRQPTAKGSEADDTVIDQESWPPVEVDDKQEALLLRWLAEARESAVKRFDERATAIRSQLSETLSSFDADQDWADEDLRLDGKALHLEGDMISKQKAAAEAQMEQTLDTLRTDFELVASETDEKKTTKTEELEASLARLRRESKSRKDARMLELNKKLDDVQHDGADAEDAAERRAALHLLIQTESEAEDERLRSAEQELQSRYDDEEKVLDREYQSTLQVYERDCQVLRDKVRAAHTQQEGVWQKSVNAWLGRATRLLEALRQERTVRGSAKRARLEERREKKRGEGGG